MKTKKIFSLFLSCALTLSLISGLSFTKVKAADDIEKIVVFVAAEGKNDKDETVNIKRTPVILETSADHEATAADAVKKVLDEKYSNNYEAEDSGYGWYLQSIGNLKMYQADENDPYSWVYWSFYLNGQYSNEGMSSTVLTNNDQISLIYSYENTNTECESFKDDSSKDPSDAAKSKLNEKIKSANDIVAKDVYDKQFSGGKVIPGIEDANGLYALFALKRAGFKADDFYKNVYKKICSQLKLLKEQGSFYDEKSDKDISFDSILNNKAPAQYYAKIALAISALGGDITNVGGVDLTEYLLSKKVYDKSIVFSRNFMILLAMNANNTKFKTESGYVKEDDLVNELTEDVMNNIETAVLWGSVDTAAMSVQALWPYVDRENVDKAVDTVFNFLHVMQNSNGGFSGYDSDNNPWSLAQYMITIGAFNYDPLSDEKYDFIKNGKTVYDAMLEWVDLDKKTLSSTVKYQPEQLVMGMTSCIRAAEKSKTLFDTTDVEQEITSVNVTPIGKKNVTKIQNYYYTGKEIKPVITVKVNNKILKQNTDFTVTYKNNVNVGTAYVIITGKGNYTLSTKMSFSIVKAPVKTPAKKIKLKKPVISKITSSKKKTLSIKYKKVTNAKKYVIQIATDKKFKKNVKKKTVSSVKTVKFTKLKSKKKYYVRVRAYRGSIKSSYSTVKSKKVK